ncbi:L,D-transpeptidase family protein [Candidatus Falkowbacteria bacterium]|nr:L,D-transpeptidase family protein [Candidatus Falkowbacteria bacterium]
MRSWLDSGALLVYLSNVVWPVPSLAAEQSFDTLPTVAIYDSVSLKLEGQWLPWGNVLPEEMFIATADLGGDGIDEIVVGAGYGQAPIVKIFRADGSLIREFLAYPESFIGGVRLAAVDFDRDGKDEIVTAAGRGGGPQVRIFDGFGQAKFVTGWMAYPESYHGGLTISAGDVDGDRVPEIIVARTYDNPNTEIKIFDHYGHDKKLGFTTTDYPGSLDISLATADLGGDGRAELLMNSGYGLDSVVSLRQVDGPLIGSWLAYRKEFYGGVNLAVADLDGDGKTAVVTGAGVLGGPHVRIFDTFGKLKSEFFAGDENFRGGVKVATGQFDKDPQLEIVVTPDHPSRASATLGRSLGIDVGTAQTLSAYENGFLIRSFLISSGLGALKTPLGDFSIWRKRPDVHMTGPGYDLPHVPWVSSFLGPYTIHGTYWHNNFGQPMSHGCINMYTPDAKWIYDWAGIGTPVEVFAATH